MADKLPASDEVLLRQIPPWALDDGVPNSDQFRPRKVDNNQLSLDRSSITTPAAAHALFTSNGSQSAAVFGLTINEFAAETLPCYPDPIKDDPKSPDNPAHAHAEYSAHETGKQKVIGKRLKALAVARGCLFVPAPTPV
jgi:hypothetical protein